MCLQMGQPKWVVSGTDGLHWFYLVRRSFSKKSIAVSQKAVFAVIYDTGNDLGHTHPVAKREEDSGSKGYKQKTCLLN